MRLQKMSSFSTQPSLLMSTTSSSPLIGASAASRTASAAAMKRASCARQSVGNTRNTASAAQCIYMMTTRRALSVREDGDPSNHTPAAAAPLMYRPGMSHLQLRVPQLHYLRPAVVSPLRTRR